MVRHYFIQFIRSLKHQKLFSFIIFLGLTVSISAALIIYLYVRHELSHDDFHHNADRIYRINQTFIWGEQSDNQFASTGPGVAWAVHQEIPEVELLTSIHTPGNCIISHTAASGEVIAFEEENVLAADTNFFAMFNFPLVDGSPATALRQSNTLVLTASTAKKYFGDGRAVGKLVRLSGPGGKEPAWFLNNFNPAEAVKGKMKPGREGKSFRDALVIFQFALSIMLIISTGIVFQQLNFVTDKGHNLCVA